MSKHTPGPWVYNIQERKIGVRDKSDTQSFGMVTAIAFIDEWDHDEFLQNGSLIAAAPDLLEALVEAKNRLIALIPKPLSDDDMILLGQIDVAIAKTKGEQQ